jgi:hypothetical protein
MSDAIVDCENYSGHQRIALEYGRAFRYSLRRDDQSMRETKLSEDLLTVAGVVLIADRAFRRRFRLGELTRSFRIQVSVNLPDRWEATADALVQALSFLSSDNWEFVFTGPGKRSSSPLQEGHSSRGKGGPVPRLLDQTACVSLFSGGLDSFCGAAYLFEGQQSESRQESYPTFVSSYLRDLSRLRDKLLEPLSFRTKGSHLHLPVYFTVHPKRVDGFTLSEFPERTRRTRSFFYLAQAAAFAASHMIQEMYLFENGVLALNLPVRSDRTGARTTRHAHPVFLDAMESFLRGVGEGKWAPTVINPFAFFTKGEILQYGGEWADLVSNTVSCWSYGNFTATLRRALGRETITHCGFCLPCVVRRLALKSAHVPDPASIYGYDVFRAAERGFPAPEDRKEQWAEAKALLKFARRLDRLDKQAFYRRYTGHLIHLDPLDRNGELSATYGMMKRFASNVIEYLG